MTDKDSIQSEDKFNKELFAAGERIYSYRIAYGLIVYFETLIFGWIGGLATIIIATLFEIYKYKYGGN